ncbi:3-phosphoshikimate 1-carboxyvinyltransferase [Arenimonas sp.]|jgi:3-phosphoshikimate 1-carboxyvinyltransferase|uniref:3-phosphoshikimate 1-carboxyvinyltransferase n=1 Tax=Arenimonas sp. TaxID=1872635 RepID=UPI0037C005A5
MSLTWTAARSSGLHGLLRVPGDKSISHRAIIFGALAEGRTHVSGFLEGEDTRATERIFSQLGVRIETPDAQSRIIHGVGLHGLQASAAPLDCGNAGTGMRLLTGLLCAQAFDSVLIGDASLSQRPMARVINKLEAMGGRISAREGNFAPLHVHGGQYLRPVEIDTGVASAQVKSALLLAAMYAEGESVITEPRPTRDYTEAMMKSMGWPISYSPGRIRIRGGGRLQGGDIGIPGDISSAAFLITAALLIPGSDITLENIGVNPRRTGILQALRLMGGQIEVFNEREQGGEPVADLKIRHSALKAIELPESLVPDMIDECPIFFVAAALAEGTTDASGLAELRVKESDRIASMVTGLRAMGALVEETPDSVTITGGHLHGAVIQSHHDHRIAMSFAVAAQCASGETLLHDCDNVATSFPGFVDLAQSAGMILE